MDLAPSVELAAPSAGCTAIGTFDRFSKPSYSGQRQEHVENGCMLGHVHTNPRDKEQWVVRRVLHAIFDASLNHLPWKPWH